MNFSIFKPKTLLVAIIFLPLFFSDSFGADPPGTVKSNPRLLSDLKDIYSAFNITHRIAGQKELLNVFMDDGSESDLDGLLKTYLKVCDSLQQTHFYNDTLNNYAQNYLKLTIQNYKIAQRSGFRSALFKQDYKKYQKESNRYIEYISKAYPMSRFVDLPEDEYWKINDKKNYTKATNYPTYIKLRETNLKDAIALLEKTSGQTADFQEYTIYQVEIADQYVKHGDKLGDNATDVAIAKYKAILDKKKYSIYLFEAWLKWRTVTQQNNGLSKSSDIPNDEYNKVREQTAFTILNYVTSHPNDKMAINEFLLMATHDIIRRFGPYKFGNQNTVEYHEIFDDAK
jgi:hypothetical protein